MPFKDKDRYKTAEYKKKQAQWSKNHYQRNRAKILAHTYERKIAMYNVYQRLKGRMYCMDCGEDHPATLHFHHRDPKQKEFNVAEWYRQGTSIEKLEEEIAKCDVLCCNCHAKRHYETADRKRQREALGLADEMAQLEAMLYISTEEEMAFVATWTAEHTPGGWMTTTLDPRESELRWLEFQGVDVTWELEELERERNSVN